MVVHRLVLLRSGETELDALNTFTGWLDPELSPLGIEESIEAGKCLKEKAFKFDCVFTSVLRRSIRSSWLACMHSGNYTMPVVNTWRLNERHYGSLQGQNKTEVRAQYGEEQMQKWRRSYNEAPPPYTMNDPKHPCNDKLYRNVPPSILPGSESLAQTVARVRPFLEDQIAQVVLARKMTLIVASGYSMLAMCRILEDLTEDEMTALYVPEGVPLVYELDDHFKFIQKYFIKDPAEIKNSITSRTAAHLLTMQRPTEGPEALAWKAVQQVVNKVFGQAREQAMQMLYDAVVEHREICVREGLEAHGDSAVSDNEATLITYANTFVDSTGKRKPLDCLKRFFEIFKPTKAAKCVHMLPMFPWDTDRGFSVKDYYKVDPRYGDWTDIEALGSEDCGSPTIMFDYVCNHASVENPWVQGALIARHLDPDHEQYAEVEKYEEFVQAYADPNDPDSPADEMPPPEDSLARLTRPRPNPVLTPYFVAQVNGSEYKAFLGKPEIDAPPNMGEVIGKGLVWTTFSRGPHKDTGKEDTKQVDLNYRNPAVLAEVVRVLMFYVRKGSLIIRLDAIGYIWKVLGSSSIHERGCHMILALLYKVLAIADPRVMTVAEVNEPVDKCLGYLGSKEYPESNMVYNFAPFPMALHAQVVNDTSHLLKWIQSLEEFKGRAFITTLGSHDGLAQKQVKQILPSEEVERLHEALINERGGLVNWAKAAGGKKIVYEICGTPWCLVNGISGTEKEAFSVQLARYVNAICLSLLPRGMPGIYMQGLVGALNYHPAEGLDENRTLNRESFDINDLFPKLEDPTSQQGAVFRAVMGVLEARGKLPQFSRDGPEPEPLVCPDPGVLAVIMNPPVELHHEHGPLLVLINVCNETRTAKVQDVPAILRTGKMKDMLNGLGSGLGNLRDDAAGEGKLPTGTSNPGFERLPSEESLPPGTPSGGGIDRRQSGTYKKKRQATLNAGSLQSDMSWVMAPYEVKWLTRV
eukprot:TRINITY_DN81235_c0_g1_i1.p1 TRINITY_DN81235_c0_g1~~TRINITY_DN81235_c0_g1_i1.p1  ORF type:complete len:978 (+),score=276.34 TRINITY_DN81235_c0_g1_i1:105-3038(+)